MEELGEGKGEGECSATTTYHAEAVLRSHRSENFLQLHNHGEAHGPLIPDSLSSTAARSYPRVRPACHPAQQSSVSAPEPCPLGPILYGHDFSPEALSR